MSKNPVVIALDIDGVLLDIMAGIQNYLIDLGHKPNICATKDSCYALSNAFPGILTPEKKGKFFEDFFESEFFTNLPQVPGALEHVLKIKKKWGDQVKLVSITSSGTSGTVAEKRKNHIQPFGIEDLTIVPLDQSKLHAITAMEVDLLVDDLPRNIIDADVIGVETILFDTATNQDFSAKCRAFGWEQTFAFINSFIEIQIKTKKAA